MSKKSESTNSFIRYLVALLVVFIGVCTSFFVLINLWPSFLLAMVIVVFSLFIIYLIGVVSSAIYIDHYPGRLSYKGTMAIRSQLLFFYGLLDLFFGSRHRRQDLQRSFIRINNHLIQSLRLKVPYNRLLILTPHCVQKSVCGIKVTGTENHCTSCGMCRVGDLKILTQRYGVEVAIATGGTLARKVITEKKPKAILAVACERDLVSGIRDASKLPVYGIANERPHGPCKDTTFNLGELEMMIKELGE
jgi:hypothetical protein